jgi:hypothetical protein
MPRVEIVEQVGNVVEIAAQSTQGIITVIAEMEITPPILVLRGLHIDGPRPGAVGRMEPFNLAREFGRRMGVSSIIIYGAKRTTGANPGPTPRSIKIDVAE